MIDITASQYIFSVLGITLMLSGLVSLVIPRHFKLGVMAILFADLCFALAIAFPKKMAEFFTDLGADESFLASKPLFLPIFLGVLSYALLYLLGYLLKKYVFAFIKTESKSGKKEDLSSKEGSRGEDGNADTKAAVNSKTEKNSTHRADPKLFEKLRAKA